MSPASTGAGLNGETNGWTTPASAVPGADGTVARLAGLRGAQGGGLDQLVLAVPDGAFRSLDVASVCGARDRRHVWLDLSGIRLCHCDARRRPRLA